tara:strand:+ start:349 stop:525 length:177 start_codon:yes stop_codon:yes gene_type:complete
MSRVTNDYYEYVYRLILEHTYPAAIPLESLEEVLDYFESVEEYEKCKVLKTIIETKNS